MIGVNRHIKSLFDSMSILDEFLVIGSNVIYLALTELWIINLSLIVPSKIKKQVERNLKFSTSDVVGVAWLLVKSGLFSFTIYFSM